MAQSEFHHGISDAALPQSLEQSCQKLVRTVFRFGSLQSQPYGHLVLRRDGTVGLYDHPNERRFEFDGERLVLFDEGGKAGLVFPLYANEDDFGFFTKDGHYLWPVLRLDDRIGDEAKPKILVNAPPRSGAHRCGRILERLGLESTQCLVYGDHLVDDRGLDSRERRREIAARTIFCEAAAIAAVMTNGEFSLGHIADWGQISQSRAQGALILHCVRDLRDALVSLWRFRHDADEPSSPADELWRGLAERDSFAAFLACRGDDDVRFLLDCANAVAGQPDTKLKFEELAAGRLSDAARDDLNARFPGFGAQFAEALSASESGTHATHADRGPLWSDAVQDFYERSGLAAANRALGYDLL